MQATDKEKELIKKTQAGDKQAFGEVFDFYYHQICRFAFRRTSSKETAEDITSEVFLSVVENIGSFRYKHKNSFKAWVYQIANNKICDFFRKNYKQRTIDLEAAVELRDRQDNNPQDISIAGESAEQISQAIAKLPEKDQEIINLSFFEDMKAEEIAEILQCSTNAAYVRLHRALKKLKPLLELEKT